MNIGAEVYPHLKNVIKERYMGEATKSVQRVGLHLTASGTAEECNWEDLLYWLGCHWHGYGCLWVLQVWLQVSWWYQEGHYTWPADWPAHNLYPVLSSGTHQRLLWPGWLGCMADRCAQLAAGIQVIGGDPTLTNPKRISEAAGQKSCNGLLLKVKHTDSRIKSFRVCKLSHIDGLLNVKLVWETGQVQSDPQNQGRTGPKAWSAGRPFKSPWPSKPWVGNSWSQQSPPTSSTQSLMSSSNPRLAQG